MRRAIMSVLLLLLVSVQAYAGMCSVRCAIMSDVGTQNSMPGMTNCGMSDHLAIGAASAAFLAAHGCFNEVCQSDLSLLQIRTDQGMGILQSQAITPIVASIPIARSFQGRPLLWLHADRSTGLIPPFDPLVSSLRI